MSHTFSNNTEYLSATETAQLVRQALRRAFPQLPARFFSVTRDQYAGGASIHVSYQGGPSRQEVEQVVRPYAGSNFDGMIDLKWSHTSFLTPDGRVVGVDDPGTADSRGLYPARRDAQPAGTRRVTFGADFIFVERRG